MNVGLKCLAASALFIGAPLFFGEQNFASPGLPIASKVWVASAISIDKAAKKIRKQTKGKILSSKRVKKGKRIIYQFKVLLPNGKVKIFNVNPEKG